MSAHKTYLLIIVWSHKNGSYTDQDFCQFYTPLKTISCPCLVTSDTQNRLQNFVPPLISNPGSAPVVFFILISRPTPSFCIPLCILFNMSLRLQKFPDQFKVALVMPLYKKGDRFSPENYRPVSLLSTLGKVFERIVFKNIYNYLLDNNLLYKYQCKYRAQAKI